MSRAQRQHVRNPFAVLSFSCRFNIPMGLIILWGGFPRSIGSFPEMYTQRFLTERASARQRSEVRAFGNAAW